MPTFFFHSNMAGAPTNTNAAGSTLAILEACLVTGFNVRAVVSASVASGVMTINYAAPHGYEDKCWIRLDGAPAGTLVQRCTTSSGASTLTIPAPGFADGAVSGTLSTRVAPADWEKPFSGTNIGVFRSKVIGPGSTRFFYRVADTVSGNNPAVLRGFESMTDANTGLGDFPTVAQAANGLRVSRANAGTPMVWCLVADGRTCYVFLAFDNANNINTGFGFGDFVPYSSADLFCAFATGGASAGVGGQFSFSSASASHYSPRVALGTGTAVTGSKFALFATSGSLTFPSPIDGGSVFSRPVLVSESSTPRGEWRGMMYMSGGPISQVSNLIFSVREDVAGVAGRVVVAKDGYGSTNRCVAFPLDEDWA